MTTIRAWSKKQNLHQGPKVLLAKVRIKPMLITFFLECNTPGVINKAYDPELQIMNSEFYIQVLERLVKQILEVSSQFRKKGSWFHSHDNAPAHSNVTVKHFLAHCNVVHSSHPLYSPYLIPVDFFFSLSENQPNRKISVSITSRRMQLPNYMQFLGMPSVTVVCNH